MQLDITKLIADFRKLSREEFLLKHSEAFFLHQTNVDDDDSSRSFDAGLDKVAEGPRPTMLSFDPAHEIQTSRSRTGVLVFPIVPDKGSPTMSRVRVGRSRENDICLPYDGVSKSHAHITWKPDRSEYYIVDLDTTNGTFVNGVAISTRKPKRMLTSSTVKFGTAEVIFREADDFYDYLKDLLSR